MPIPQDRLPPLMPTLLSLIPQAHCYFIAASIAKAIPSGKSYLPLTPPTPPLPASIPRIHLHLPTPLLSLSTHQTRCHADSASIIFAYPRRIVSSSSSTNAYNKRGTITKRYLTAHHGEKQPEGSEADEFTHKTIFSDGSLPGPSGSLAKNFQKTYRIPTQCQKATGFNGFL